MNSLYYPPYVFVPLKCDCGHVTWYTRSPRTWDTSIKARCSGCGQTNDLDDPPDPRLPNKKASKKRKR